MKLLLNIFVFLCFVSLANAHSWIACTNYRADPALPYQDDQCFGYPRNWNDNYNEIFGRNMGLEYRGSGCDPRFDSTGYTERYPMAQYTQGEEVWLAWGSLNHVSAEPDNPPGCENPTSRWIPDNGIRLFISEFDNTDQDVFYQNEITPFGVGISTSDSVSFTGFQHCPRFCKDNERSVCTGNFTVPKNLVGDFTFQWFWEFNVGEFYSTCFDATIVPPGTTSTTGEEPTESESTESMESSTDDGSTSVPNTSDQDTTAGEEPTESDSSETTAESAPTEDETTNDQTESTQPVGEYPVEVSTSIVTQWQSGSSNFRQYEIVVKNIGSQVIKDMSIHFGNAQVDSYWNCVVDGEYFTLPSWIVEWGLHPASEVNVGLIVKDSTINSVSVTDVLYF